ncbi:MAG: glycosyltransferase family 4 protein [Gammaproteobacteria bacterium]|nr:glycosyltransferase family 4 protein [Gammaproteobacteria bacterium]MBU2064337.1 glycosyltransferase family 4 protein [Gammaproteobacteria bacterium]MBU2179387.1 glycosyltransferase family 4 protein [Gammaproteobacteria bacterium]MBU2255557.1 glycosyltransferase family 4 protein [Gammaproteobacteria bacterium]
MSKFVFVHLYNDRSGSPKVLSQVVHAFNRRGIDFDVLTSDHADGFLDALPGNRERIFYRRSENKLITLLLYVVSQILLFFKCLRYARQDVIFYVNTMMPFGAALAGRLMGKPVIYHVHETSLRPKALKFFLRSVIKVSAAKVVFVSDYLRLAEGFKRIPQFVVHNAIDVQPVALKRTSGRTFTVLMVCSLKVYKGVLEFLDVARLLVGRADIEFKLVLNAEQDEIDKFLVQSSFPTNVEVYPRQSDVTLFYSSASMLMNLSRPDEWVETFGLTILEAMAYGLPVIVPPVGGPVEIVTDGREGYCVSCYDVKKIAGLIERLDEDYELYASLSNHARERASEFQLDKFEDNVFKMING